MCAKSNIREAGTLLALDKSVAHNAVDVLDGIVSHQLVRRRSRISTMKTFISLILFVLIHSLAEAADPTPSKDAIKKAAAYILSCDCGNAVSDPGFAESSKILKDAGPAIIPALVELVPDTKLSPWFVGNAGGIATNYPFSEPLRAALRVRREDKAFEHDPGAMLHLFDYFVAFGDQHDLVWMESAISRMEPFRRSYAAKPLQKFRERIFSK